MMHMEAAGWLIWMALGGAFLLLPVLAVAVLLLTRDRTDARQELERRYAAGEIGADEYHERLYTLEPR
jgi:hypothetical protein